jgi:hypothetical protein
LTSKYRCHSASGISKTGIAAKTPALLTRMSRSGTASISVFAPSAVPTSAATPLTRSDPVSAVSALTVSATRSSLRPLTTTSAPARASAAAVACPIPEVEPVTRALFPVRSMFMFLQYYATTGVNNSCTRRLSPPEEFDVTR